MAAHLLLPILFASWWEFPAEPIGSEVSRGAETFKKGKGIERTLLADRVALGTWYDGKVRRDVEQAIRLSPGMISRWLGYLEAKEKWPPGEMAARWNGARLQLDGKLTFAVQISSMPRVDLFEPHLSVDSFSDSWREVRFLVTLGGRGLPRAPTKEPFFGWSIFRPKKLSFDSDALPLRIEPNVQVVADLRSRDRSRVLDYPWYRDTALSRELAPEFDRNALPIQSPIGEYKCVWLLVSASLPANPNAYRDIQLWVFSKGKERLADWSLPSVESAPAQAGRANGRSD